jgi:predicted ArsR family transcriptional regulator
MRDVGPVGSSHRSLLDALKRRGAATVPELAAELGLNVETLREHLQTLESRHLVHRAGQAKGVAGRPSIVYALTDAAEALFPRSEGELLRSLSSFLVDGGHTSLLRDFYESQLAPRRQAALARVEGLTGRARLDAVTGIFAEMGYMPVLEESGGAPHLRLCHCPVRDMVDATQVPCRAEISLLRELLSETPQRESFMPDGAAACTYRLERRP